MSGIASAVGKRLRIYRLRSGLSQEQLAELAGFHPTYVGQVERGEKNLTLESLEKMCRALGVSFSRLFEGMSPLPEEEEDVPLKCYDLVNGMSTAAQERTLRILNELREMENE